MRQIVWTPLKTLHREIDCCQRSFRIVPSDNGLKKRISHLEHYCEEGIFMSFEGGKWHPIQYPVYMVLYFHWIWRFVHRVTLLTETFRISMLYGAGLTEILLVIARKGIVSKWKSDAPVPVGTWLSEINSCIPQEKITYWLRNKFTRYGNPFWIIWKTFHDIRLIVPLYSPFVLRMCLTVWSLKQDAALASQCFLLFW